MRSSGKCPKCDCPVLLVVEEFKERVDLHQPEPLFLVAQLSPYVQEGKLELIMCTQCGFVEFWGHDFERIKGKLNLLYPPGKVYFWDSRTKSKTPFR